MRLVLAIGFALVLGVTSAFAQAVATNHSTSVTLNELLAPWLPLIVGAFMTLVLALLGALTAFIKQRFNLEENKFYAQMEAQARDTLQSALTNAAGRVVLTLGDKLKDVKLNVYMPEIRQAILQVNNGAADAVSHFKLSEEDIANMIINKIGVVTAPNPQVIPAVEPAAPPKPGTPA